MNVSANQFGASMPGRRHVQTVGRQRLKDRRKFLRGLGVAVALPPLQSLTAEGASSDTRPHAKRFVCVASNYGLNPDGFFPSVTGSNFVMPPLLKPLEKHRKNLTIFSNLDHPGVGGGHGCSNTFLNGVEAKAERNQPQRMQSLDQFLALQLGQRSRFPSLHLGSGGISWSRRGVALPTMQNPAAVFAQLFLDDAPKTKKRTRDFLKEDASILDVVRSDAKSLRRHLSKEDQQKLDQYVTSIREVEIKLKRREEWIDVAKPELSDSVIRGSDQDDRIVDLEYPFNTSVMYELMVLALQTESSNVICFGHPGGNRLFPFDGVSMGYHSLTHHGKRPELLRQLAIIESFYLREFATFLGRLAATPDQDGKPLLDSTVVLFGSGMGNASSHSSRNLPILLAGGGFQHGQHHRFERQGRDGRPLCDLFVTVMQKLGIERDRFSTSTHDLNHLLI